MMRDHSRRRRRCSATARAFTLVEALMVTLLLTITGVLTWTLLSQGLRREARIDFRTRAIQVAALARARIAADVAQLLPAASLTAQRARGQAVAFDRVSESAAGEGGLPLTRTLAPVSETVSWRFDPSSHRLMRNGQPVGSALFADAAFEFEATQDAGYTLHIDLEIVPEEELGRRRPPSQVARFRFTFHSPQGTLALAHREWVGDRGL
jgi:hypothetical protein